MKKLVFALKWLLLLAKRLFKKPAFIVILLLIPALCAAMALAANEDSGLLTVAVAIDGEADDTANEVVQGLREDSGVLLVKFFETPEDAVACVKAREADAAWIIAGDLDARIKAYVAGESVDAMVSVYEEEETSIMAISREAMYGKLYPHISRALYVEYNENWLGGREGFSVDAMMPYYDSVRPDKSLIDFKMVGGIEDTDVDDMNYLTSPLRGMLSVAVLLCALASGMLISGDIAAGRFSWLAPSKHIWLYHSSGASAAFIASAVAVVGMVISGISVNIAYELLAAFLFSLCAALFCSFVATVLKRPAAIGASIPIIVIAALLLSPVFIRFAESSPVQMLLPTYLYINSSVDSSYIGYMCIYIIVFCPLCALTHKICGKMH